MANARPRLCAAALLVLLIQPLARAVTQTNCWMYVGSYTSRGGRGIYLFRFDPAAGRAQSAGLAAGRIWEANSNSFADAVARMFAQFRVGWPSPKTILRGVQDPIFLTAAPNRRALYSADDTGEGFITAFAMDPGTGRLKPLNQEPSHGRSPTFLSIDPSGRNLLTANFDGRNLAVLPIEGDGRLRSAAAVVWPKGSGADRNIVPHPHSIAVAPGGRFAVATDLTLNEVLVYKFSADSGALTPNNPPFIKALPGAGARHFVFHPNGRFGYLIHEAGSAITPMRWDAAAGILTPLNPVSTLPPNFHGVSAAAEIHIHPSGKFLYASNRGHDSIAVFAIDGAAGTLTPVQFISSGGQRPRSFVIDPSGRYLFAVNVDSQNVVQFRIDPQTGALTTTGTTFHVPYPSCIIFVENR